MAAVVRGASAGRDLDLVEAIRTELAAIEPARPCCRAAEWVGLGSAASGQARSPAVARLAVRLDTAADGTSRGGVGPDGTPAGAGPAPFDWDAARDHCRIAWLRGRLLSCGSLSLGVGRAHLELVVDATEAAVLAGRVAALDLPAAWRIRRGRGVITWKSTERILALLSRLGASGGVLEAQARLVTRQLHGHLNRVLNAETSNLGRSVAASLRQRQAIDRLAAAGALPALPSLEREVARVRQDQPDATLTELAVQLKVPRARVQRAIARLESAALQLPGGPVRPPDG